jgi:hypothetical protein
VRLKLLISASGLAIASIAASLLQPGGSPPQALASDTSDIKDASGPSVALLATKPGALHTSLYLARTGGRALQAPVATFTHLPDAVVRGSVVPGTSVVVATADTQPTRDPSFNASLFRLAPHEPPELLCDGVVHASRPLATPAGRVLVSRGVPGIAPDPSSSLKGAAPELRVDALSIDEVDLATGALRTVHTYAGYLAFLAGAFGPEAIVYRVSPAGADLIAVDIDSGAVRTLLQNLPPFARDFSVDAAEGALVFRGRHETHTRIWTIERVDLKTGKATRLHESPVQSLAPHILPGGAIAYNPDGLSGLALLDGGDLKSPLGPGVDLVIEASPDARFIAALHTAPGSLPIPFVIDTSTGASAPLLAAPGSRIAVAGFIAAEGGSP